MLNESLLANSSSNSGDSSEDDNSHDNGDISNRDVGSYFKMKNEETKNEKSRWMMVLMDLFPLLQWLPLYDMKEDLLSDSLAGLTVSVCLLSLLILFIFSFVTVSFNLN